LKIFVNQHGSTTVFRYKHAQGSRIPSAAMQPIEITYIVFYLDIINTF
jgi:hypothetical protein